MTPVPAGRVARVCTSPGGVPKTPVPAAHLTARGLEGDGHRNRRLHGGPERALCLFSLERIDALSAEGHAVVPGALGENITVTGLDWATVVPGARLALGAHAVVQVTRYADPCRTIRHVFAGGDASRVGQARHPGWSRVYARVLAEGRVCAGDFVWLTGPS